MSLLYIRDKDGKLVPVPALNYVLTEEDKQEIAELAAEMVEVPVEVIDERIEIKLAEIPDVSEVGM